MAADGTSYEIEMVASMPGGDAAVAAVGALEKALVESGNAATSAAEQLSRSSQRYSELEKAADVAAKAVERAKAAGKDVSPELQRRADEAAAALKHEAVALDAAKSAAEAAGAAHVRAASELKTFTDAAAQVQANRLSGSIGTENSAGLAASLGGVAAGFAAAGVAAGGFYVEAARAHDEAARVSAQLDALSGGAGARAREAIDGLAASIGESHQELDPLAARLLAIGTPVDELGVKLKALAAQQALGLGGDQSVLAILGKLHEHLPIESRELGELARTAGITGDAIAGKMGLTLKQLDLQMKSGTVNSKAMSDAIVSLATEKGLPALNAHGKSFAEHIDHIKDGFKDMLADAASSDDATAALSTFEQALSKDSETGKEMRAELSSAFKDIAGAATAAAPVVVKAIGEMVHVAGDLFHGLENAVGVLKGIKSGDLSAIAQLGEKRDHFNTANTNDVHGSGADAVAQLEAKHQALEQQFKSLSLLDQLGSKGEGIADQATVLEGEIAQAKKAVAEQNGSGTTDAGKSVSEGYAAGIRAGIPDIISAAEEASAAGQAALKRADDSHSPSRKYEALGMFGAQGYAQGWDRGSGVVQSALSRVGGPVTVPALAGAAAPAARAGLQIDKVVIEVHGGDGSDLEAQMRVAALRFVENVAQQLGAGGHP